MTSALGIRDIDAQLCAPGAPFELETLSSIGRQVRMWRHAPRSLREILERSLETGGARDFIVSGEERLTHQDHYERVIRFASTLAEEFGVVKGDRVAIAMRNVPEWSIAFFAACVIGAIAVPLNAMWNGAELAFALDDCEPKVLVADGQRLERLARYGESLAKMGCIGTRLEERKTADPLPGGIVLFGAVVDRPGVRPEVAIGPDDLATIFYTSGSTSNPKGVLGNHRNICANVVSLAFARYRGALRAGMPLASMPAEPTVALVPVPLFHVTGCHSNLVAQAYFGGTVVLMRKWDVEEALALIERERVSAFSGVPTMVWELVNYPSLESRDLKSLRSLGGGGAAAPPALLRRIQQVLPLCGSGTGYGMTESSSVTASIGGIDYVERPSSVGVPVPICDVRIADECGAELPVGEIGEIWISGPTVVPGYWRRPEETALTFADGWLHSGDLGRVDEDGFLHIVDRAKDLVIRGGENISSIEVEAALLEHPAVFEVAVFAVPHEVLGEQVGAVVRRRPDIVVTADDLRRHVAALLAPFKVPTYVWLTDEPLPRGGTGKIQKREVKVIYAVPAAGTASDR